MKKNIKLKNKFLTLFVSLFVFSLSFLPAFGNEKIIVRAEDDNKRIITGNIFITVGDGKFTPLIGNASGISFRVYDGFTFVASCFVNSDGQFYLELPNNINSTTLTCRIADVNSVVTYDYMYNDRTYKQAFGEITEPKTAFNCYFRYYPVTYDPLSNVTQVEYNIIKCDTKSDTLYNTRLGVPGLITDYYNAMDFQYTLHITKKYGSYPAFWLNINDNSNKFVAGLGVIVSYAPVEGRPIWNIYVKNNATGSKLLINRFDTIDTELPDFNVRLRLLTYKINNIVYIEYYYMTSANWYFFEKISLSENSFINNIVLQPASCACTLTYSIDYSIKEPARADLSLIKNEYFDKGFNSGYSTGWNIGYTAGVNTHDYSFVNLISSVVDVPVKILTNLFDVEILGVNMKSFIFSIATVIIVVVVIRIWLGSRGV